MLQAQPGGNGLPNVSSSVAAPAPAGSSSIMAPGPSSSFDIPILQNSLGQEAFVKGVGTHMWQSSGDESSNWTHILRSWGLLNYPRFFMARLFGGLTVLESCPNSWDRCVQGYWADVLKPDANPTIWAPAILVQQHW
jgi:hypothetical protein